MAKKYYFPHDEYVDSIFGGGEICCFTEEAINKMADEMLRDYGAYDNYPPAYDPDRTYNPFRSYDDDEKEEFSRETVWSWFHEADEDEIERYGVCDEE